MIMLGRLFAAALLVLCAFPGATGGEEKTAPPTVVMEDQVQALRIQLDSFKKDFEQKLDRIESLIGEAKPDGSSTRPDDSALQACCRPVSQHVPCCRDVYHHEPCCRHAYHREPCCRHVYHSRRVYHAPPCCRYAYYPAPWYVDVYGPERWLSEFE
jgi:hypothetical protein